jgi:hypothetical protein
MKLLVRRHVATVSYRLDSYGMQEVRGSNPRSSTSQLRVIDSNSRCEAAFLFRANVRDVAILGESAKGQINGGATALRIVFRDLLHCRQAVLEWPSRRCSSEAIIELNDSREQPGEQNRFTSTRGGARAS